MEVAMVTRYTLHDLTEDLATFHTRSTLLTHVLGGGAGTPEEARDYARDLFRVAGRILDATADARRVPQWRAEW